jgi:exonuclease III
VVLNVNVQSLTLEKLQEVQQLARDCKADVVVVTETWLAEKEQRKLKGYRCFKGAPYVSPNDLQPYRGVCVFVRRTLDASTVVLEGEPDPCIHGVSIRLSGGRKVFIAAFYSAGVTAAERTHEVEQAVHFWEKCRSQGAVMLVGDFNGHSAVGTSAILELQERTGMVCLNASVSTADSQCPAWLPDTAMQPTASTGNVLDLFFGSPSLKRSVSDFEVLPPLVSGTPHFPVKAVFHLTPVRVDDKAEVVERLVTKWKSAYGASKEKKSLYVRCLQDKLEPWLAQWSGSLDCRDNIEAAVSGLRRILQSAGATAFGTKTFY